MAVKNRLHLAHNINECKDKREQGMTRVRVNLRLAQTEKAENILRVNRYRKGHLVSSASVAFATAVILKNVVPVINEAKCAHIGAGHRYKDSCAWLEGELVAWSGRLKDNVGRRYRKALEPLQRQDVFADKAGAAVRDLQEGTPLGFNPKKFRVFYERPAGAPVAKVFERAAAATIYHWQFAVTDAQFRSVTPEDAVSGPAPVSDMEVHEIPKGIATTIKKLSELRPSS
jgi:hypothetical protein